MMQVSERHEVRAGSEVWAHWHYSDRDQRAMRGANLTPKDDTSGAGAVGYVLAFMLGTPALLCLLSSNRAMALAAGGMVIAFLPMVLLVKYSERQRLHDVRDRMRAGIREVRISPSSLRVDKLHIALTDADFILRQVTFQRGTPALLTFTSSHYHITTFGPAETGEERVYRLPVPQGREQEAVALAERFRAQLERPK